MPLIDHLQSLTPPTVTAVALGVAVLALVVHEPLSGRRSYARFRAEEAVEGEPARVRFYRSWTRHGYVAAALAVALVLALPGVGLAEIGFRLPDLAGADRFGLPGGIVSPSTIAGMITGALLVVVAMALLAWRRSRRVADRPAEPAAPTEPPRGQLAAVLPMLPRTRTGRRGWAQLSLSAGVTEEITYRGLLLLALAVLLPSSTPQLTLVVVAAALFGVAHWYQGWPGILSTGLTGAVLSGLYLATGSLLVPMVLHTLVDLRALLLPVPALAGSREGADDEEPPSATSVPPHPASV